ncbi:MAG: hypothetical protein M0R06_00940 [Sphaerochaeta sp.]|nr:hypothetical protein [Sphaerochaeta sp.]
MIIYVVTRGRYSDYTIEAVYDDKELAEELVRLRNDLQDADCQVEEYELNALADKIKQGLLLWRVVMLKNGDTDWVHEAAGYYPEILVSIPKLSARQPVAMLYATVWAKDKEHAVKIVNEKRARIIALGLWKDGYKENE